MDTIRRYLRTLLLSEIAPFVFPLLLLPLLLVSLHLQEKRRYLHRLEQQASTLQSRIATPPTDAEVAAQKPFLQGEMRRLEEALRHSPGEAKLVQRLRFLQEENQLRLIPDGPRGLKLASPLELAASDLQQLLAVLEQNAYKEGMAVCAFDITKVFAPLGEEVYRVDVKLGHP
jgi:hypothetical protein